MTDMSKYLQTVTDDADFERCRRGDVEAKLAAIRKAASYRFPIPDIDTLLAEIEASRLAEIEAGMPGADGVCSCARERL